MADLSAKGIGKRILKRRKAIGLSQMELSDIIGVPQQTIAGWEKGVSDRPRKLMEAADALFTTQIWLLKAEGPEVVIPPDTRKKLVAEIESLDQDQLPQVLHMVRARRAKKTKAA